MEQDSKLDPKLKEILTRASEQIVDAIESAIISAEHEAVDADQFFDSLSHVLAQRVGQMEILRLESIAKMAGSDVVISRDLLLESIEAIQNTTLLSLSQGMEDMLKSGGHFTLTELREEFFPKHKKYEKDAAVYSLSDYKTNRASSNLSEPKGSTEEKNINQNPFSHLEPGPFSERKETETTEE